MLTKVHRSHEENVQFLQKKQTDAWTEIYY